MKGLYSRERYLEGIKFEKCDGFSKGIQEKDKKRRSATNKEEKIKTEGS